MNTIKTTNLCKVYRTEEVETTALQNVSIEIRESEFVAIMGPSGCGKSSLLNILGMIDQADSGKYYLNAEEITVLSEKIRARIRKENVGFVFQSFNLIDELTVFENVELPLIYCGIPYTKRKIMVNAALEKMKIEHRKSHFPQQLSGGQQQRVAVARAVVHKPKLLLADEPTGNLDSQHGEEVMKLLASLNAEGSTIVMVTHSLRDAGYAHRTINLLDGKIILENQAQSQLL